MALQLLLAFWLLMGAFAGGFVQIIFAYGNCEVMSFRNVFYFAERFYTDNVEQLNRAGLILGIVLISIAVLPGSVLWILICIIKSIFQGLWFAFKWIFRKRKMKGDARDGTEKSAVCDNRNKRRV